MEKELKFSELAHIWGVSVVTVRERVGKLGLQTFKKKDETNKEVTYVRVSDEVLQTYPLNRIFNVNNKVNNGYYEDMLKVNNINNSINNHEDDVIDAEYTFSQTNKFTEVVNTLTTVNNAYNERLTTFLEGSYNQLQTINKDYNERLQALSDELVDYKSKALLLEDKASREGYYINEINVLKEDYKGSLHTNKIQTYIIGILIVVVMSLLTYLITVNNTIKNLSNNVNNLQETVINEKKPAQVQEVVTPAPAPVKKSVNTTKRKSK